MRPNNAGAKIRYDNKKQSTLYIETFRLHMCFIAIRDSSSSELNHTTLLTYEFGAQFANRDHSKCT